MAHAAATAVPVGSQWQRERTNHAITLTTDSLLHFLTPDIAVESDSIEMKTFLKSIILTFQVHGVACFEHAQSTLSYSKDNAGGSRLGLRPQSLVSARRGPVGPVLCILFDDCTIQQTAVIFGSN